jgi:TatA/E family protein of Tat protein translocase
MDFFGLGWMEIGLVLLVALLIWGPNRIVSISRTIGKTMHTFRKAANELTAQVNRELEEEKNQLTRQKPEQRDEPVKGK